MAYLFGLHQLQNCLWMKLLSQFLQCVDGDWTWILYAAVDVIDLACLNRRKGAPAWTLLQHTYVDLSPANQQQGVRSPDDHGLQTYLWPIGDQIVRYRLSSGGLDDLSDERVLADGDDGVVPNGDQDPRGRFTCGARSDGFDTPFQAGVQISRLLPAVERLADALD